MRLYTRTGDKGETGLIGSRRVPKDDPRVATYGQLDELNASIGWAAAACSDDAWRGQVRRVQDQLFSLGAELANPDADPTKSVIADSETLTLEQWIDQACEPLEPLKQFVLPGGSELAGRFHLTRTVCRRAERSVVTLSRQTPVAEQSIVYLNRLSDLLFAWARLANARANVADIVWPTREPS